MKCCRCKQSLKGRVIFFHSLKTYCQECLALTKIEEQERVKK